MITDNRLKVILEGFPMTLNKGQCKALNDFVTGRGHSVLLGEGGCGKSLLIQLLKKYYTDEMITCALSGVANQNLFNGEGGNGTFHKVMSIPVGMATAKDLREVSQNTSKIFAGSDLIKVIVIDEAFMMNSDMLNTLLHRVKRFNKRTNKRKERFIRILLVGDPLQLPPIVTDEDKRYLKDRYGHHLMFRSSVWNDFDPTLMVLDKVERQKDRVFRGALNVIRYGETDRYNKLLKWLNRNVDFSADRSQFTVGAYNKTVNQVNERTLRTAKGLRKTFKAEITGNFDLKDNGVDEYIEVAVGLDYITLVNHQEGYYNNGSFCTVEHVAPEGVYVRFHHNDEQHLIEPHEYKEYETYIAKDVPQEDGELKDEQRRRESGVCYQIPMKQASAFSIHRSQGRTFDKKGILDMGDKGFSSWNDFGTAALYVGLSRFTKFENIVLPRPLNRSHIKVCEDSVDFWFEAMEEFNGNS